MGMQDYRTIVVGTDGSDLAVTTVARAAWLAHHDEAELIIVCAITRLSRREGARSRASAGLADTQFGQVPGQGAGSRAIAEAVAIAEEQRARVSAALLLEGEPAAVLLETGRRHLADLIVVGAIRDRSIAGRLLGTVATEVVKRAHCEVLVVRPVGEGSEPPDAAEGLVSPAISPGHGES